MRCNSQSACAVMSDAVAVPRSRNSGRRSTPPRPNASNRSAWGRHVYAR
jgi:hypothetical protein